MRTVVVYKSVHHHNTERVARAMAEAIGATCISLEASVPNEIKEFDLIGFGSGIYYSTHHPDLLHFVTSLGNLEGRKVFIFSTSGFDELIFHQPLKEKLQHHGAEVVGEFKCGGWHTYGPFGTEGGLQQGRPDRVDLQNAAEFARDLIERLESGWS